MEGEKVSWKEGGREREGRREGGKRENIKEWRKKKKNKVETKVNQRC